MCKRPPMIDRLIDPISHTDTTHPYGLCVRSRGWVSCRQWQSFVSSTITNGRTDRRGIVVCLLRQATPLVSKFRTIYNVVVKPRDAGAIDEIHFVPHQPIRQSVSRCSAEVVCRDWAGWSRVASITTDSDCPRPDHREHRILSLCAVKPGANRDYARKYQIAITETGDESLPWNNYREEVGYLSKRRVRSPSRQSRRIYHWCFTNRHFCVDFRSGLVWSNWCHQTAERLAKIGRRKPF